MRSAARRRRRSVKTALVIVADMAAHSPSHVAALDYQLLAIWWFVLLLRISWELRKDGTDSGGGCKVSRLSSSSAFCRGIKVWEYGYNPLLTTGKLLSINIACEQFVMLVHWELGAQLRVDLERISVIKFYVQFLCTSFYWLKNCKTRSILISRSFKRLSWNCFSFSKKKNQKRFYQSESNHTPS